MDGKLTIYDTSWGSLACRGTLYITNDIITEIDFSGYPRTRGDGWVSYFNKLKRGDTLKLTDYQYFLSFNGKYNVISKLYSK